ncbi:MAG: MmgE/PrpD family protein [Hyphomicrobiaceae bacterium]|nr:MmgE/PrpD family protein [Hyphomicrobiaceae bacterium]
MSVTSELCNRIEAIGYGDLSEAAVKAARQLVLDGLAVAIAGPEEEAVNILAEHYKEQGGTPQAHAIAFGFKTNMVSAAMLNGASMHVLDFEPMWSPANHQLSTTLPAVLAVAEHTGADGRAVATALVKGIEMQGWLRQASGQYMAGQIRFHPPGAVGTFGSAVAAGHILGLDAGKLANAIGMAASRAGSLLANAGTMTKSTHCGHATGLGLECALLAARGFTANTEIFEAGQSYANAFCGDAFKPEELLNYGPPFRVVTPGYAIKMFPSQFGTHFAITAGLDLRPKLPSAAAIKRITMISPVMNYVDRPVPATGLSGKFSLQYTLAAALLDGKVRIHTFTDERLAAPDMQALLAKIELIKDPSIPARFEEMHIDVKVELEDGTIVETRCNGPRGKWGTPPISVDEHMVKVRDCLATRLDDKAAAELIGLASNIDGIDAAGVRRLMEIASCKA